MKNAIKFQIKQLDKPQRLDRVLRDKYPEWGRKAVNQLIQQRQVQVNGKTVWLNSWKVKNNDWITVQSIPEAKTPLPTAFNPAWLIRDDGDVIAVNKPAGLLSDATRWQKDGNLLSLAQGHLGDVRLFHRLDRDTSGVVLLTRKGTINHYLDTAFKAQMIEKIYYAWVAAPNRLDSAGIITLPLAQDLQRRDKMAVVTKGGKHASTHYQVELERDRMQLIRLMPKTGRTHQLRVHLQAYDAPILGDRLYSPTFVDYERLYLNATQITLPATDDFPKRTFIAPNDWTGNFKIP